MIGMLCIHGFTGSPYEFTPLTKYLQQETDWLVRVPTLPGHDKLCNLKNVTYTDWIRHAEEELFMLLEKCDKVYVCGFSMGGLIAGWLTAHYPIDKLILLSPAVFYSNPKNFCLEAFEIFIDVCKKRFYNSELFQNFKRKFLGTPIHAYMEFRKLVRAVRPVLDQVSTPTLIIQGKRDPIVPEKSAYYLFSKIATDEKRLLLIENAKHQICFDRNNSKLFEEIYTFLNENRVKKKIAMTMN